MARVAGNDPSANFGDLLRDIRRAAGLTQEELAEQAVERVAHNPQLRGASLPRSLTSFVGRGQELRAPASVLSHTPLLTLVGAGGVGKSRLAHALVRDRVRPSGAQHEPDDSAST